MASVELKQVRKSFGSTRVVHGVDISIADGEFEPGMTVCVESYIGEVGGEEGVKLEEQVLITETGAEPLSTFPFEDELLPSRWV